jgi:hypothetical protein
LLENKLDVNLQQKKEALFHCFPINFYKQDEIIDQILEKANKNLLNQNDQNFLHILCQSSASSEFLLNLYFVPPFIEQQDKFCNSKIFFCDKKIIKLKISNKKKNFSN